MITPKQFDDTINALTSVISNLDTEKNEIIEFQKWTAKKMVEAESGRASSAKDLQTNAETYLKKIITAEKNMWGEHQRLSGHIGRISNRLSPEIAETLNQQMSTITEKHKSLLIATEAYLPQKINREAWEVINVTLEIHHLFTLQNDIKEIIDLINDINTNVNTLKDYFISNKTDIIQPTAIFDIGLNDFFTENNFPIATMVVLLDANFVVDAVNTRPNELLNLTIPGAIRLIPHKAYEELTRGGEGRLSGLVSRSVTDGLRRNRIATYPHIQFESVDESIRSKVMKEWRKTDDEDKKKITAEKFQKSADFQIIYYCITHPDEDITILTSDNNLIQIIRNLNCPKVRFTRFERRALRVA